VKKVLLWIGIASILIAATGTFYAASIYNQSADMMEESHEDIGTSNLRADLDQKPDPIEDNVSVLFIGVDNSEHRDEYSSRSDALILATFNKDENSVKLLSIPRDSYVYVPKIEHFTKIAHAHAYGGVLATIGTVEDLLDVPVDYFVRLNFNAFVEIIDALGGIMFDLPYEFTESNSDDKRNTIHLDPGYQHLNGEQTLALARTRKKDNDMERGKRQQQIMKAIADKTTSLSTVFKLEELISAIGPNMKTNFTLSEIRAFLSYGFTKMFRSKCFN